jgi:hypothetical protein
MSHTVAEKNVLYTRAGDHDSIVAGQHLDAAGFPFLELPIGDNVSADNTINNVIAGKGFRHCPTLVESCGTIHSGLSAIRAYAGYRAKLHVE